jgi:hypothetical protein
VHSDFSRLNLHIRIADDQPVGKEQYGKFGHILEGSKHNGLSAGGDDFVLSATACIRVGLGKN